MFNLNQLVTRIACERGAGMYFRARWLVSRSQTVTLAVTIWTTAVERFVLGPPEVGWAISARGTAKGMNLITHGPRLARSTLRYRVGDKCEWYCKAHESHYIRATPSVEYSTLYTHRGRYVMRFMTFAVPLTLIAHPTSGGTQNETLNGSCPDCYSERNSLASRDYSLVGWLSL